MRIRFISYCRLLLWIALFLLISAALGNITDSHRDSWYASLEKSSLTPPGYVFGIVWSILYGMLAIAGWLIWRARCFSTLFTVKSLYIIQLLLNWSWTPLFFHYHYTGVALLFIIIIIVLVAILLFLCRKSLPKVTWLLTPYSIWLIFAAYLNGYIWYVQ